MNFENSKGYKIFANYFNVDKIDNIAKMINGILKSRHEIDPNNIFLTEDLEEKKPKQLQHLEQFEPIKQIGLDIIKDNGLNATIANMQLFIKYPGYKITKPHQDGAYFGNDKYATFWIPLSDVDKENSCLYYLEDSHRNGLLKHDQTGSVLRTRTGVTGLSLEHVGANIETFVPIKMAKGDMVVHHPYTLHYSSTNKTDKLRMALTLIVKF
jgi:ectoine hydroxylase-related dioxygenase (phytanoyl-CoA dioxygenase family)